MQFYVKICGAVSPLQQCVQTIFHYIENMGKCNTCQWEGWR